MAFQEEQPDDFFNFDSGAQNFCYNIPREYRAQTPKNQSDFFPMTPDTTPFSNCQNAQQTGFSRTAESSPTRRDPQLTIKASQAMQRGGSYQDNFAAIHQRPISPLPSPPHTAPLKARGSVDYAAFPPPSFLNMSELNLNVSAEGKSIPLKCEREDHANHERGRRIRQRRLFANYQGFLDHVVFPSIPGDGTYVSVRKYRHD